MCDCQGCGKTREDQERQWNRTFAIALDGKVIFDGMSDQETIYEYRGLMDRIGLSGRIEIFQHVEMVPVTTYKIV